MWPVTVDPLQFKEAIGWHRARVSMTREAWDRLAEDLRTRAFTVAHVAQLDMIRQVWAAIEDALREGQTLEEFKKAIGESLRAAWQGKVKAPAWRLETIFRTDVQSAYSAGRYAQSVDPDVLAVRPYWMFDGVLDDRTTDACRACDAVILPANHPWWQSHYPPLHYNCRSGVITLTDVQATTRGIALQVPVEHASPGFGRPAPVDKWEPDASDYPQSLWAIFKSKLKST